MNPTKRSVTDIAVEQLVSDLPDSLPSESVIARACVNWLAKKFREAGVSSLDLRFGNHPVIRLGVADQNVLVPRIDIVKPWAVMKASRRGLMGWAEAYMDGDWSTPDIRCVTHWAMNNEYRLEEAFEASWLSQKLNRLFHRLNDNTRKGSRRNISAHYDLGNDFYRQWLDAGMTYSSALYCSGEEPLEKAQSNKYSLVLDWLELKQQSSILEIGCGWGGFAEALALQGEWEYRGVTLSKEQLAWSKRRMAKHAGFEFSLTDYRDIHGQFDRIVSIEMLEAVGESHWPVYFQKIYNSLKPGGVAVLQVITIDNQRFDSYRDGTDFIQKYIFPGGMLPSPEIMKEQIAKAGLKLSNVLCFGTDYAATLAEWFIRFNGNWAEIKKQGFDQRFQRMWNYYLAYCEAGFNSRSIDVRLYQIRKPQ